MKDLSSSTASSNSHARMVAVRLSMPARRMGRQIRSPIVLAGFSDPEGFLEHHLDTLPVRPQIDRSKACYVAPIQGYPAGCTGLQSNDCARDRGLAAAAFSNQSGDAASPNLKGHAVDGPRPFTGLPEATSPTVVNSDILNGQHKRIRFLCGFRRRSRYDKLAWGPLTLAGGSDTVDARNGSEKRSSISALGLPQHFGCWPNLHEPAAVKYSDAIGHGCHDAKIMRD